jgi:hypothetical protein
VRDSRAPAFCFSERSKTAGNRFGLALVVSVPAGKGRRSRPDEALPQPQQDGATTLLPGGSTNNAFRELNMPLFHFTTLGADGTVTPQIPYECVDREDAKEKARDLLSRLAATGVPNDSLNMLSVEIYDEGHQPLHEIRLVLEEIPK